MEQHIQHRARVTESPDSERLDQVASQMFPQYSRTRLQQWIRSGCLTVDGECKKPRDRLMGGEWLEIDARTEIRDELQAESMDLEVIHGDEHLLIINKPAGLVTHPAPGHWQGTLLNGLLHAYPELASVPRAGLVHRLDQHTSGLLVVARHLESHTRLVELLQRREINRQYDAVVFGVVEGPGRIDMPIARHPVNRKKMSVRRDGKPSVTHYRVVRSFTGHTHLRVKLETGRTHQIRVHLSYMKHPLVGDSVYGGTYREPARGTPELKELLAGFDRQALHARKLEFVHPFTGVESCWQAPCPDDMTALLDALARADSSG